MLPSMPIHFWHNYLPKFLFLISEFVSDEADQEKKKKKVNSKFPEFKV